MQFEQANGQTKNCKRDFPAVRAKKNNETLIE